MVRLRAWLRRLCRWGRRCALTLVGLSVLWAAALRWIDPRLTLLMLQRGWEAHRQGRDLAVERSWVPLQSLSPQLLVALAAAEDQLFLDHHGFDLASMRQAIAAHRHGARLRGASTLSQQTAKNVFLWPGRSWLRKALEAYFTLLIELLWGKARILEVYANVAETGDGVFGCEAAARRYFGRPAATLGAAEAALIAAALPDPRHLRLDRPSPYLLARRDWVLRQMENLGGSSWARGLAPPSASTRRR